MPSGDNKKPYFHSSSIHAAIKMERIEQDFSVLCTTYSSKSYSILSFPMCRRTVPWGELSKPLLELFLLCKVALPVRLHCTVAIVSIPYWLAYKIITISSKYHECCCSNKRRIVFGIIVNLVNMEYFKRNWEAKLNSDTVPMKYAVTSSIFCQKCEAFTFTIFNQTLKASQVSYKPIFSSST